MSRYGAFVFIGNPMLEPEVLLICSRLIHRNHNVTAVMGRRGEVAGSNHAAAAAAEPRQPGTSGRGLEAALSCPRQQDARLHLGPEPDAPSARGAPPTAMTPPPHEY